MCCKLEIVAEACRRDQKKTIAKTFFENMMMKKIEALSTRRATQPVM